MYLNYSPYLPKKHQSVNDVSPQKQVYMHELN